MKRKWPSLLQIISLSLVLHLLLVALWVKYENFSLMRLIGRNPDVLAVQINYPDNAALDKANRSTNNPNERHALAYALAPSAPTAEEWAFASRYTLKNSKGYRYTWGKQVRSMMGTAVDGPDQGQVRFRIAISPNGTVTKVETLWKTSDKAETLARKAIFSMPPLPTTPTGKSLIFERTISFTPFATDDNPFYADDCLPDPPSFTNPFAWDGKSPQAPVKNIPNEKLSPKALAECLKELPQDTLEAVNAHNQRQLNQWESTRLNQK